MKNQLLAIFITISSTGCYSQISFEKGYYINNNGEKIECEIKNTDWKNNPTEFEFRLSENTEQNKANIKLVKEFGIYNYSKYIRSIINIDRSSNNLSNLSTDKNPILNEEELFLKVLVEGKSSLYQYGDGNLERFFFSYENSHNIEQLIYKKYKYSGDLIGENNKFKQQLLNNLKCQDIKFNDLEKISYKKKELINIFLKYNQCSYSELINFEEKQKKDLFNLTIRPRLNSSSLFIENSGDFGLADFGNQISFGLGVEAEFILSFNKNKWAVLLEPSYQYFKSEKEFTNSSSTFDRNATVDYKSVQLAIGIRHYFFLNNNNNTKLFVNAAYIRDFQNNSKIDFNTGAELEITTGQNLGFGVGYKQNNKYSLELRFQTSRGFLGSYQYWLSEYKTASVIFGYSIF